MKLFATRKAHMLILLLMLAGMLYVQKQDYDWIKSLRYLAFDNYNRLHPRPPTDKVAIVDIDEATLGRPEIGQWPWPRTTVAKLVNNLHAMGARAIVFDIVFAESDRTSPQTLLQSIPAGELDAVAVEQLKKLPDHDQVLADSIKKAGNVVTGFIWSDTPDATRRLPVSRPIGLMRDAASLNRSIVPMIGVATNIPLLEQAAAGNGNFGVSAEVDGLIRKVPLLFLMNGKEGATPILYPSLAVEALRVAQDHRLLIKVRKTPENELGPFDPAYRMKVGDYEIPFDSAGNFYVWFSKARTRQYIPAWQVLSRQIDPSRISGKVVFVGTSAEGLKDIRSTPLNLLIPGVEVHVNVVEQALTHAYLLRPAMIEDAEWMAIAGVGLMIILLAPFIGAVTMAFFTMILIGALGCMSFYGYVHYGLLLDPVYPGLALLILNAVSSLLTYMRTEAERKQVKGAFGLYISQDYMKELTRNPDKLKLGGEVKDLTVMFTDIRGFTSIAESMPPADLIHLMNDFLTPMSDLVMKNRGTIDKYMGDAMMAFWNAPLEDADHARHACIAALHMNEALTPINARLEERKLPVRLQAGIGINSGHASVGNMGSKQRFAYSALGDTVNLASRLEGQTKTYGVDILIGEETASRVADFALLELDLLKVKGKNEPVRVFTVLGEDSMAQTESFKKLKTVHDVMIAEYRAGDFERAGRFLNECRTFSEEKRLAGFYDLYAIRLAALQASPPGADWDGVFTAVTK